MRPGPKTYGGVPVRALPGAVAGPAQTRVALVAGPARTGRHELVERPPQRRVPCSHAKPQVSLSRRPKFFKSVMPGRGPPARGRYKQAPGRALPRSITLTGWHRRNGVSGSASGQSGLIGDFAARSRAAALPEAAALLDEETHDPAAERNE